MKPCGLPALVLVALLVLAQGAPAQPAGHWRIFNAADGLAENACVSITLGASGSVLVRHAKSDAISVVDGYSVTVVPGPGMTRQRVHESPGGQLWTTSTNGLEEYRDGQWVSHHVKEIEELFRTGFSNAIPLWPVRQGRVLVLLPERLLQFTAEDSDHPSTETFWRADQSKLRAFTALSPARDGGLWIVGQQGVAKINGPLRALRKDAPWREFIPPEDLHLQNLHTPQEIEGDGIAALAESSVGRTWLTHFDGQRWTRRILNVDGLRFAWRFRGHTWAVTTDSLFRLDGNQAEPGVNEEISARRIFDVAVEPSGAFWLATSDGLLRYAPLLWDKPETDAATPANRHTPAPGSPVDVAKILGPKIGAGEETIRRSEWTAATVTKYGDVWLGGPHEIAWRRQNVWRMFNSTNQIGPENVLAFASAADGHVWCATPGRIWEFNGKNWLTLHGGIDQINDLLCSRDGTLWVASAKGLHRYFQGAWITYGADDGLPSTNVRSVLEDDTGHIWAETDQGTCMFHAEADLDPPRTKVHQSSEEELLFRDGAPVTISFTGQDKWKSTRVSQLLFSHRLDEQEWSAYQEAKDVFFSELPLGRHYFQVRAMDRNGNVDLQPARLEFAVVVPWYRETRLVLILSGALVVALFFAALALNRQRQLRFAYAEVEKKIAERTRELEIANRELLHSQKMNALGTLAAGIAHDFNNILSIIKGSAQIIEDNVDNAQKIRTRTDRIKTVVEQGSGIVRAMLGFSSNPNEEATPCDLNAVVNDTIKLLGDRFLREVQVTFKPAGELSSVTMTKDLVQQVLLNFIFNASEAVTTRRQIVLSTIALERLPDNLVLAPKRAAGYVAVAVRDFGTGIASENLPRIFEPFFTTKALSTKRGTGLGLSMVYELAKKLEAGLHVETAINEGSTFSLILAVDAHATPAPRESNEPVSTVQP